MNLCKECGHPNDPSMGLGQCDHVLPQPKALTAGSVSGLEPLPRYLRALPDGWEFVFDESLMCQAGNMYWDTGRSFDKWVSIDRPNTGFCLYTVGQINSPTGHDSWMREDGHKTPRVIRRIES